MSRDTLVSWHQNDVSLEKLEPFDLNIVIRLAFFIVTSHISSKLFTFQYHWLPLGKGYTYYQILCLSFEGDIKTRSDYRYDWKIVKNEVVKSLQSSPNLYRCCSLSFLLHSDWSGKESLIITLITQHRSPGDDPWISSMMGDRDLISEMYTVSIHVHFLLF